MPCWWGRKLMQPLWKTIWRFLQKLKSRISIRSSNSTSGNICEGNKRLRQRDIYIPVFTATLFLTVKIWKRPMGLLMDDRSKNAVCIYRGIQFRSEKERKSTICNNTDRLKGHMLSEINQTEQDKL